MSNTQDRKENVVGRTFWDYLHSSKGPLYCIAASLLLLILTIGYTAITKHPIKIFDKEFGYSISNDEFLKLKDKVAALENKLDINTQSYTALAASTSARQNDLQEQIKKYGVKDVKWTNYGGNNFYNSESVSNGFRITTVDPLINSSQDNFIYFERP